MRFHRFVLGAGANTIIAADELARSAGNDTIMTADVGTLVFNPYLYRNLRYDVERDFSLAGGLVKIPMMLIAREGLPASSLEDLLRHEKSRTEALTYASVGAGSIHHLAMELLARRTGMTLLHVPYKGVGPAMQDVLAGRIDLMMIGVAGGMPHVAGGRVKALAVAADQPVGEGGKIPTFAASGLPGFEVYSWMAAIVPATADAGAKAGLERSLQEILARQEVRDTLKKHGLEPMPMNASELHEHLAAQRELWGELLSKLEIALD